MKKDEAYYKSLPSAAEMKNWIKEDLEIRKKYKAFIANPNCPEIIKKHTEIKLERIENRIATNQFALDMLVKGWLEGKAHKKVELSEPEARLYKAIFGEEEKNGKQK